LAQVAKAVSEITESSGWKRLGGNALEENVKALRRKAQAFWRKALWRKALWRKTIWGKQFEENTLKGSVVKKRALAESDLEERALEKSAFGCHTVRRELPLQHLTRAQCSEGAIHSKEKDQHFMLERSNQNTLKVLLAIWRTSE
jgi:hypothetical protein